MRIRVTLLLLLFILIKGSLLVGQEDNVDEQIFTDESLREEVQRYFGYEDLLFRYVTIPYDINANVNQQGKYVDIGFTLFALIPIILLSLVYKRKKWFYLSMLLFFLYLLFCFRFSFLNDAGNGRYNPAQGDSSLIFDAARWEGWLLQPMYELSALVSSPFVDFLNSYPNLQSYITYPFIVLLFSIVIYIILKSTSLKQESKSLILVMLAFGFLWWILSGGIIWYGFVLLPLCFTLVVKAISGKKKSRPVIHLKPVRYLSIGLLGIWIFMAYTLRISNISLLNYVVAKEKDELGKMIVDYRLQPYSVGAINEEQCINLLGNNLWNAFKVMNDSDDLVYQAGTSLVFDIRKNDQRVFEDNTLTFFYNQFQKFTSKKALTEHFKLLGFKFIILDLMIPTLDRTPEKSLTTKYIAIINFLRENNNLSLVATDRLVQSQGSDGTPFQFYGLEGDKYLVPGSYIVYQIK